DRGRSLAGVGARSGHRGETGGEATVLNFFSGVPLTILAAVVVLGVLIFVHELGHFIAAKAVGVGVPRFSLGLGPVTPLRWRRGETEYVISWIPFGGYVKMATAEEDEEGVLG